ncbi:MAG: hypothetical protein WBU92_02595 [Candidatus Dormiibacterota bacterium]
MAAGLLSALRKVEKPPAEGDRHRSWTGGQNLAWREMMALLSHVESDRLSPEQQTCTECDSEAEESILPPEYFLG